MNDGKRAEGPKLRHLRGELMVDCASECKEMLRTHLHLPSLMGTVGN